MFPKLSPEPVYLFINGVELKMPREKIAASYAGSCAAKELMVQESYGFIFSTFQEEYKKTMPACIEAANKVGLSATVDTLDYWYPGKCNEHLLRERAEHPDNPNYPFSLFNEEDDD